MDPNPVIKLPTFVNTRQELSNIVSEREKIETELRELEEHMLTFEDSILKRGGPYFGKIAQGERAGQILEKINKSSLAKLEGKNIDTSDHSSSDSFRDRKVPEVQRLFSNSSVTSPALINLKQSQEVKPMSHNSYTKHH